MLNILSLKLWAIPILSYLQNDLEPFTIVPLKVVEDEKKLVKEFSWYHCEYIVFSLFIEYGPERVQLSISELILLKSVELHQF